MCVGVTSTERLEIPESDGSEKAGRITVDDDFHCLGYSVSVPGAFPVCVRGIQSVTEKAIMGPEGRRLDIEYDRVAAIVGSGKARFVSRCVVVWYSVAYLYCDACLVGIWARYRQWKWCRSSGGTRRTIFNASRCCAGLLARSGFNHFVMFIVSKCTI